MAFNWPSFLRSRHIFYATSGPNVAKGAIAIKCPFCGHADPSEHLVIRLNGQGWWCWRNKSHRGGSAAWLVSRLIGCSFDQALALTDEARFLPAGDFLGNVKALLFPETIKKEAAPPPLEMPREFRYLDKTGLRLFRIYLKERRGFSDSQIDRMDRYDIRCALGGAYARRVIFPVYFMDELVGWSGRSVDKSAFIRYKTLSHEREKAEKEGYEPAPAMLNTYLLWYDKLMAESDRDDNLTLLVCEGPMDALKVNVLGERLGIRATCIFTSSPTPAQKLLLYDFAPRFKRRAIFLDRGMLHQARRIQSDLRALEFGVIEPPERLDDPGELSHEEELAELVS